MGFIKTFGSKIYNTIWKKSHDVIHRYVYLSELYDNVPKELKDIQVEVLELHYFDSDEEMVKSK